eukprot:scaffold4711_cov255-Chaetoceros_neogracile.AAC.1
MTTSRTLTTISRDNAVLFTVGRWMDTMGAYGSWIMDFTWNFLLFNGEMMMSLVSLCRSVTCDRSCDKIMKMPEEEKPVV